MSFHGSIPRSSGGADEEASSAADRESAAAPKRSAHGVELRQWTKAKPAGGCSTDPHRWVLVVCGLMVGRRGINVGNEPTCSTSARTWVRGIDDEKKSSLRGTDNEISPYRRLTELISSVPRIGRVSSVPRSRSARSAPGV
ncbi:hypothetical protein PGTUg99_018878 [Puccinia graminis f. sp. tritici]|uniref:Uncharacterized protein n=1 Tax=Puccinia graminis f. sp. tritici TaxID=56615 RepID=A0A5B0LP67_PUCGR|nr:hypothetical protein PGTUg99_018878 [Puccinia graminis f. sp. tritici]